MPSANKTETIKLSQYEGNECQKRLDVNEDNLKIDNKFKLVDSQISENKKNIYKNINDIANLSNPNLLINGDFQIWQKGAEFTSLRNDEYYPDRWRFSAYGSTVDISNNCTLKKTDEGLQMTVKGLDVQQNTIWGQPLEDTEVKKLLGETITLSVCLKYKNLAQIYFGFNFTKLSEIENTSPVDMSASGDDYVVFSKTIKVPNDAKVLFPRILLSPNKGDSSYTIKYIKLEIGEKATPLTPRLYGEDLALCQRYYQSLNLYKQKYYGVGILNTTGGTNGVLRVNLSAPLRQYPTIILKGQLSVIPSSSITIDDLSPGLLSSTICKAEVTLSKELPVGVYMVEGINAEDSLALDAEIY